MANQYSIAVVLVGLTLSASTFRSSLQAARGEGPRKLRPLSGWYWFGLILTLAAAVCQMRHIMCTM